MKVNEDLSILFWLKREKATKEGLVPIYVRITVNGNRDNFSSGKKIHPDAWDDKAAIAGMNCPDYKLINSYVAKTRVELEKHYNQLVAVHKKVTAAMIKDAYMPKQTLQKSLMQAFKLISSCNRCPKSSCSKKYKRFPADFMFQLTEQEWSNLKSQIVTSSWGGRRTLPYAFMEQGVAMLSGILNSDRAIAVNIQIMRVFVRVRQMLIDNTELSLEVEKIKGKLDNQDKNMEIVFRYLDELIEVKNNPVQRRRIGFKPDDLHDD